jgi:hypothetical protein
MIDAAGDRRRADVPSRTPARLLVATWAEALPLLGLSGVRLAGGSPDRWSLRVVGMGRRAATTAGEGPVLVAGFAGACRAELRVGDVILAGGASPELRRQVGAVEGELRTLDHVASPVEKAALGAAGVAAVDMETAWLAEAAAGPFLSVRVVIDRLDDRAFSAAAAWHYPAACSSLRRAVKTILQEPAW